MRCFIGHNFLYPQPWAGLSLNRTNGKDSRVRLRTNFLSITCCAIKGKEIRWFETNLPFSTVGWVIACGTVSLGVRILKVVSFFFPFSKFLSLVSLFRVRLSVILRLRLGLGLRLGFEPSSPIVCELFSVLPGCPSHWYDLGTTLEMTLTSC